MARKYRSYRRLFSKLLIFLFLFNNTTLAQITELKKNACSEETSIRFNNFLTIKELKIRPDTINLPNGTSRKRWFPWCTNWSMGNETTIGKDGYLELRENHTIPDLYDNLLFYSGNLPDTFINKSGELSIYNYSRLFINQSYNIDPELLFNKLKKTTFSFINFSQCFFKVQPISDFIFLNDTVKHVSFIKCAFSGNLNILFEQNKIESFTFIDNWSQLDSTSLEKLLNMSNLEVLDISQNSHIDFSNNVSKLKKIKSLKLGGLHLRQLPIGIFELPELQILDLSNNYIRDIPLDFSKSPKKQAFFPIIDSLTFEIINEKTIFISQLSSLNLSNNCLTNFSIDLTGLEAMYIDLSHNNFTEPPKGLYSLSSNQTVRLDACLKPKIDTARLKCIVEFDE